MLVTAVSERADLCAQALDSLLARIDVKPVRLLVHEDEKQGSTAGELARYLQSVPVAAVWHRVTSPARGLGPAVWQLLQAATTPIVLYTQDDWLTLRDLPVRRALRLMERHDLHHIAFGKRTTPAAKHPGMPDEWRKAVRMFDGQPLTVAQMWRAQASLWRVDRILPFFHRLVEADSEPDRWAMVKVNRWMNETFTGDVHGNDHDDRAEKLRTFLWGGIGEPAFIEHTGGERRAELQSIEHYRTRSGR